MFAGLAFAADSLVGDFLGTRALLGLCFSGITAAICTLTIATLTIATLASAAFATAAFSGPGPGQ